MEHIGLIDSIHIKKNGFIDWSKIDWSYDDSRIANATNISIRQVRKNRIRYDAVKIAELEQRRKKEREEQEAAEIKRRKEAKYAKAKKHDGTRSKYSRKCHDCGKPTNNYRCPTCLEKWRIKNCVPTSGSSDDDLFALAI